MVEEDVLGFYVAVGYAAVVEVDDGVEDFYEDRGRLWLGELAFVADVVEQVALGAELHEDECSIALPDHILDFNNIGMPDSLEYLHLVLDPVPIFGQLGQNLNS